MQLNELLYIVEGELEEPQLPMTDSTLRVLIVTDDGGTYEPTAAACDGELLIINAKRKEA